MISFAVMPLLFGRLPVWRDKANTSSAGRPARRTLEHTQVYSLRRSHHCAGDVRVKCVVVVAVLLSTTGIAAAQTSASQNSLAKGTPIIAQDSLAQNSLAQNSSAQASPASQPKRTKTAKASARPLPVVIPQQFAPPQEEYASFPDRAAAAAAAAPSACQTGLGKVAEFKPLPVLVGAGECGATDAVLMTSVILPDQSKVAVSPPATLRCPMAQQIADWVREDVAPSMKKFGPPLRVLDNFDSYSCRGRNNIRAAQLSEHGKADAIDIRDFALADGREFGLTNTHVDKDWRDAIKTSVCARFSTVLGPGSDGYHEEHIHLDLAERHNNYKVCQWDVRVPPSAEAQTGTAPADSAVPQGDDEAAIPIDEVPLPRPRPKFAFQQKSTER
jgi:hypothetical protein